MSWISLGEAVALVIERAEQAMTITQLRDAIRLSKDLGHSKVPVPLSVLSKLIADAEKYRSMPAIVREAGRHIEART